MKHAVKLVKEAPDSYVVGGYGVVFGGADLRGEWFTPSTDLWMDRITETPMVLYDHGFNPGTGKSVLGQVIAHKVDDIGLWIEAEISAATEYADAVRELVKKGVLGWSSGAVQHLCEIDRTGEITSWPIAEFSLTATPCEPRTVGVSELDDVATPAVKALADAVEAWRATWTTAYVNSLPDSAFALILPGGEKDDEGKTTPRSLRKLPHHDADGKLDMPHLRNAMARAPQMSGVSEAQMSRAMAHLEKHAKGAGVGEAGKKALPSDPVPVEDKHGAAPHGSYEAITHHLNRLLNQPMMGGMMMPYACVVATFPDFAVVVEYEGDEVEYYEVAYTLDADGMPVLGERRAVQRVYVPIESPPAEMAATAVMSAYTIRSATALRARVSALHQGRVREGRTLSSANRSRLQTNRDALADLVSAYDALLTETEPTTKAAEVGATDALVEVQAAYARILAASCGVEVSP